MVLLGQVEKLKKNPNDTELRKWIIENAIDVSNLSSGLYFLQMKLENGEEQIQRVIKK